MVLANALNINTTGIVKLDAATGIFTATTTTNHAVLIGATSNAITNVGPTATAGQFLQSAGAAADPAFSTATLPSTATGTGKVLVADGTNWVASTPTFPNASATSGKIIQSDGTNWIASTPTYPTTAGTAGKIHISDGTNIVSSTPTYPNSATGTGKVLIADGTNWVASTPTFPNASATSGKFIRSDGTNWVASTPTLPTSAGTSGKVLQSDGTNYVESTPTYPSASGTAGKLLRSDGTNNVYTTSTYPDTNAVSTILYASSANVMAALATGNDGVLITSHTGVPSWLANGTTGQLLTATTNSPPTWTTVATGTGDVVGPGSATDNALVRFDSTTGKLIQNGVITEDDTGNLSVTASVSGATLSTTVSNTSNTASSNALQQVTVAGTSAGDAFTTYTVAGTTNWSVGTDNSVTGDPFVIAASNALGTTNIMSALVTGEINYPLQVAFLAYLASTALNKTGNSASYTIGTDALTEVFDQNSDFNTNGTFTAPVTGRYQLSGSAFLIGNTILQIILVSLVTSNRSYGNQIGRAANASDLAATLSLLVDMDAADTATVTVLGAGEAGNTSDVSGVTPFQTFFSGYLAC